MKLLRRLNEAAGYLMDAILEFTPLLAIMAVATAIAALVAVIRAS